MLPQCGVIHDTMRIVRTVRIGLSLGCRSWRHEDKRKRMKHGDSLNSEGWLRDPIIQMGPVYVKIGQLMSARTDLFPVDIINELKGLQDSVFVNDMTGNEISELYYEEHGCDVHEHFASFEMKPFASGSIAQVHGAMLHTQIPVAVKIQKTSVIRDFQVDLKLANSIVDLLLVLNNKRLYDFLLIIKECTACIDKELDFENEMNNMRVFRAICAGDDNLIVVPRVYVKLSTKRLLVMENVPSMSLEDIPSQARRDELSRELMTTFIRVIFKYGWLHADPHPGNIGWISETNKIALYDYGLVSRFPSRLIKSFRKVMYAILRRDAEEVIQLLLSNEIIYASRSGALTVNELDPFEFACLKKVITYVFDYISDVDIRRLMRNIRADDDIDETDIPFLLNSDMIIFFKSMSTLEGVCKDLNNDFNYQSLMSEIVIRDIFTGDLIDIREVLQPLVFDLLSPTQETDKVMRENDKDLAKLRIKKLEERVDENNLHLFIITSTIVYMVLASYVS